MKLLPGNGIMFERGDFGEGHDYAGHIKLLSGETIAVVGRYHADKSGISLEQVPFSYVHANPKYYALTTKQAKDAELGEPIF